METVNYIIDKDNKDYNMSENNTDTISKGDLLFFIGVLLPITISTSFLTYITITQYFKWKSLDTEIKNKCKEIDIEFQIKCKQIENECKQFEYEAQIKCKQLDNEYKQLDNEYKRLDNEGKRLQYEF